ncbi:hypothetical protein Bca4012_072932 [Brassica carinata]
MGRRLNMKGSLNYAEDEMILGMRVLMKIIGTVGIVSKQDIIRCIARNILSQNHPRIDLEGHTRK